MSMSAFCRLAANCALRFLIAVLLVAAFKATPVVSAQSELAGVYGRVTDKSGAVIVGADVEIKNVETNLSVTQKTNDDGFYTIPSLRPGHYTIMARKQGFQSVTVTELVLNVQDNVIRNFSLQVGSVAEAITVTASQNNINTSNGAVSTVVDRQFVDNIPMNGRSFQSLIALVPGVVTVPGAATGNKGEFSINGQRTEENYYTVDGVSANSGSQVSATANATAVNFGASASMPGETSLGTTQSLVSLDALQEFRIETSTYSAEYGRTPGGQISFVTRSGTNAWHGSGFDYFRNSALDANSWFNNNGHLAKTGERQNDFGGTLGGPIDIPHIYNGRDKTFFFFSYEGLRVVTPQPAVSIFVPDTNTRTTAAAALQPYVNAFPIQNGAENGVTGTAAFLFAYSAPGSIDTTSIRIDHTFNSKLTVFGRYSDAPSQTFSRSGAAVSVTSSTVRTLTVGSTDQLSSHLVNEFRYNYTWNSGLRHQFVDNFGGATPLTLAGVKDFTGQLTPIVDNFSLAFAFGGNPTVVLQNLEQNQRQFNVVDSVSNSWGRHSLKFGVDYRQTVTPLSLPHTNEGAIFLTLATVKTDIPAANSQVSFPGTPIAPLYKNFSLFAQDEWKATQRLSLSFGLRWDVNPAPSDADGHLPPTLNQISNLSTGVLNPAGTPFWHTTYANFAPRLGMAYQLRQASGQETVLRGGFGVFYDTGNTYASFPYNGIGIQSNQNFTGLPFPLTTAQFASTPPPNVSIPYSTQTYAFDPHLQLPYTLEWNVALQQGLGKAQSLTVSYVGAAARRLLYLYQVTPSKLVPPNPNFAATANLLAVTQNKPTSDYDALQAQFQRRLSHGLQAMASYTWSHSIDQASSNNTTTQLLRANSTFDIRHNFQAAFTYDVPGTYSNPFAGAVLRHWELDSRISGRSALPLDIISSTVTDALTGLSVSTRADVVLGQPAYLYGAQCMAPVPVGNGTACPGGGRALNFNAFTAPTAAEIAAEKFGNAPRDSLRGFDAWQTDLAVRREFPIHERLKLQFRAEAFNVFNHPIFGTIQTLLSSGAAAFGRATGTLNNQLGGLNSLYQQGGPRSLQLSLRLVF